MPDIPIDAEDLSRFKKRLMRTKTLISQTSVEDEAPSGTGALSRVLTTYDLISLGVGSCAGTGMYVVAGLVAKNVAGPATILSFMIAAFASILSGLCYAEFGVRVPKTSGSAYMYSYVTVGEFVAFLIGWNLILEYMIGSAAGASAISACFDALTNHSMSTYLEENVGTVIGKTYPDFLGFFIGIGMTTILSLGVKNSLRFNNILNVINFVVFILIIVVGMFMVEGENWKATETHGGFAPYGASGVFSGAATCFYAFIGFDIIATTGEEAQSPSKSIPIAIITSLVICLVGYVAVTLILTLMVPYNEIHGDSALIDMFVQRDLGGMRFIVVIGALCALTVSLLGSMFPMPRVIYAMSRDGLLFQTLSYINHRTGTPLLATVITGVLASFMSLLVGLQILVEMMSIGTLLAYTLVCTSVLILRYQPSLQQVVIPMATKLDVIEEVNDDITSPDSSSDVNAPVRKIKYKDAEQLVDPTEQQKGYGSFNSVPFIGAHLENSFSFLDRHFSIFWDWCGFPNEDAVPTDATAQFAIIFVGALLFMEMITCLLIVFGADQLSNGDAWAVLLLIVFLMLIVTCLVYITRQPQNRRPLPFMVPAVPLLPGIATFFNMYLMLKLPGVTWMRLGIWICFGLLCYFSYSMWHSAKERKQREKEIWDETKQKGLEANGVVGTHNGGPPKGDPNGSWPLHPGNTDTQQTSSMPYKTPGGGTEPTYKQGWDEQTSQMSSTNPFAADVQDNVNAQARTAAWQAEHHKPKSTGHDQVTTRSGQSTNDNRSSRSWGRETRSDPWKNPFHEGGGY